MVKRSSNNELTSLLFPLCVIVVCLALSGCQNFHVRDLSPVGPIAQSIDELFWLALSLMALILVPVFALTIWVTTRYRESCQPSDYDSNWHEPPWLEWLIWLLPSVIVLCLAWVTWIYTHRLDPYRPLPGKTDPIEIQVVALDWKWLFIYPKENIATVNQVAFPIKRPVVFKITSGTVMNSFFIPRLAGQIYAMAGMETQLHLVADQAGHYFGENSQYSGKGFPYQYFSALALSENEFEQWLIQAQKAPMTMNFPQYELLAKPSMKNEVKYYGSVTPDLFAQVMALFTEEPTNP